MQYKKKILNKDENWNRLKNYRPNDVVNHNNNLWQNLTGVNSEPSSDSTDWVNADSSSILLATDVQYNENLFGVTGGAVENYATKKVNTIEDLRNTDGEYDGQIISLLGYYSSGDKDIVNYKYQSEKLIDDGGSVINTTWGSWVAQFYSEYNIKDFGVLGNGNDERLKVVSALSYINGKVLNLNGLNISIIGQLQLLNRSNFTIKNGTFKAHKNSTTDTENRLFIFNRCGNFNVENVIFDGNRQERNPQEKAIHNISLRSCFDFKFSQCGSINSPLFDAVNSDGIAFI